jgi:hypothetical protein
VFITGHRDQIDDAVADRIARGISERSLAAFQAPVGERQRHRRERAHARGPRGRQRRGPVVGKDVGDQVRDSPIEHPLAVGLSAGHRQPAREPERLAVALQLARDPVVSHEF